MQWIEQVQQIQLLHLEDQMLRHLFNGSSRKKVSITSFKTLSRCSDIHYTENQFRGGSNQVFVNGGVDGHDDVGDIECTLFIKTFTSKIDRCI